MTSIPNTALINRVNTESAKLSEDQKFISENKGNASALAGRASEFQKDWETFQGDTATLQNSHDISDVSTAQTAEASGMDTFDQTHHDLQDAVNSANASNDPNAGTLQSAFASITDQGNANTLHLQALNNNIDAINSDTGAKAAGNPLTPEYSLSGGSPSNSVYGTANGGGIATGGTRSPEDIHNESNAIHDNAKAPDGTPAFDPNSSTTAVYFDDA